MNWLQRCAVIGLFLTGFTPGFLSQAWAQGQVALQPNSCDNLYHFGSSSLPEGLPPLAKWLPIHLACVDELWKISDAKLSLLTTDWLKNITLQCQSLALTPSDNKASIDELGATCLRIIRISFFHQQAKRPVNFNVAELKSEIQKPLQSIYDLARSSPKDFPRLLNEWIILVDTAWMIADFYEPLQFLTKLYADNISLTVTSQHHAITLYSLLYMWQRAASNTSVQPKLNTQILTLLYEVSISDPQNKNPQLGYLVNNALWAISSISYFFPKFEMEAQKLLQQALIKADPTSEAYIWAIKGLTRKQDCFTVLSSQSQMCKTEVVEKLKKSLFPNRHEFFDDKIRVHSAMAPAEAEKLILAARKVREHFFEVTGYRQPLADDPNLWLEVFIYSGRRDYETYHSFVFDMATNNGGIYNEDRGHFYTYERSAAESRYSLLELFCHEYVHYLVGRYIVPGMWGKVPLYQNNRMVWFDEGLAEYLVASGNDSEALSRKSLLKTLQNDALNFQNISEVLHASYASPSSFYSYSAVLMQSLISKYPAFFKNILAILNRGDATQFETLLQRMHSETHFNGAYQTVLGFIKLSNS